MVQRHAPRRVRHELLRLRGKRKKTAKRVDPVRVFYAKQAAKLRADPNYYKRGKLEAEKQQAQNALVAGRHREAHHHHANVARERRHLLTRERRPWRPAMPARRMSSALPQFMLRRRMRGCPGRPRARAHRTARPTRAGPSHSSGDGRGESGDGEPPAGQCEARLPTTPGRSRR